MGPGKEIVGVIRGCIKIVTCGKKLIRSTNGIANSSNEDSDPKLEPICTKLAYILGLRVSPSHRYIYILIQIILHVPYCGPHHE